MPTTPKGWPEEGEIWPTHGNVVDDRDYLADAMLFIEDEIDDLLELLESGEFSRDALIFAAHRIKSKTGRSIVILVQNKAKIHPSRLMR